MRATIVPLCPAGSLVPGAYRLDVPGRKSLGAVAYAEAREALSDNAWRHSHGDATLGQFEVWAKHEPLPGQLPKACGCGALYDVNAWDALPWCGIQPGLIGPPMELRHCVGRLPDESRCPSTIGIDCEAT